MPATYEPIASLTLANSTTATVDIQSIPASWTDLVLVVQGDSTGTAHDVTMQFNGDTASNYSQTYIRGTGSVVASGRYTVLYLNSAATWGSGKLYTHIVHLMSYANSNVFKTSLSSGAYAGGEVNRIVNLWRSTAAISSVQVKTGSASIYFSSGTTFALYGIKAA